MAGDGLEEGWGGGSGGLRGPGALPCANFQGPAIFLPDFGREGEKKKKKGKKKPIYGLLILPITGSMDEGRSLARGECQGSGTCLRRRTLTDAEDEPSWPRQTTLIPFKHPSQMVVAFLMAAALSKLPLFKVQSAESLPPLPPPSRHEPPIDTRSITLPKAFAAIRRVIESF